MSSLHVLCAKIGNFSEELTTLTLFKAEVITFIRILGVFVAKINIKADSSKLSTIFLLRLSETGIVPVFHSINRRGFLTNLFISSSRAAFEKIMPSCFTIP